MKLKTLLTEKINYSDFSKLAKKYDLRLMLLFGSAISGNSHSQSDVDVAIMPTKPDFSMKEQLELQAEIQTHFIGREVDLVLLKQADPLLLKKIVENHAVLFGKGRDLANLKIYAFKRYVDHARYFKMEEEYLRRFTSSAGSAK